MRQRMSRSVKRLLGCCFLVGLGFLASVSGVADYIPGFGHLAGVLRPAPASSTAAGDSIRPEQSEQLVMIYFGASSCGWCTLPETHALIEVVWSSLRETARERSLDLVTLGVAMDDNVEAGLSHLRSMGNFDQVSSGYGWANVASVDAFAGALPRVVATPTVAVVRRRLNFTEQSVRSTDVRLVAFREGLTDISRWAGKGSPIRVVESTNVDERKVTTKLSQ